MLMGVSRPTNLCLFFIFGSWKCETQHAVLDVWHTSSKERCRVVVVVRDAEIRGVCNAMMTSSLIPTNSWKNGLLASMSAWSLSSGVLCGWLMVGSGYLSFTSTGLDRPP